MSVIKCRECGKEVSDKADRCPHCGVKLKKNVGVLGIVFASLVGYMVFSCNSPSPAPAPRPEKTAQEKEQDAKKELAFQKVVAVLKSIKTAARDPDSIAWESIDANEDASVICIAYRGQNGFGGMSKEVAVAAKGKVSQTAESWNRNCAHKSLYNMMHARQAL